MGHGGVHGDYAVQSRDEVGGVLEVLGAGVFGSQRDGARQGQEACGGVGRQGPVGVIGMAGIAAGDDAYAAGGGPRVAADRPRRGQGIQGRAK